MWQKVIWTISFDKRGLKAGQPDLRSDGLNNVLAHESIDVVLEGLLGVRFSHILYQNLLLGHRKLVPDIPRILGAVLFHGGHGVNILLSILHERGNRQVFLPLGFVQISQHLLLE